MQKRLPFPYPFAGYSDLDFINCFASAYMSLEGIVGDDDYDCPRDRGEPCTGCGNCSGSTAKRQEDLFFFFGTISGCNALRCRFDGQPTEMEVRLENSDETIEFVTGLAGYPCTRVSADMPAAVAASIGAGRPLLARMKGAERSPFRVIVGCDGSDIVCPEPTGAQAKPDRAPTYDELECLYVFSPKTEPRHALVDGLRRIAEVMTWNRESGLWDETIRQFDYWGQHLADAPFEEIQRRFKRVSEMMWHTFNCHNFAETCRHRVWPGMDDVRLDLLCAEVDAAYDLTHTRAWQVIGMNECRDWATRRYNELEWGMCASVAMVLESIKENDARVLAAVEGAIEGVTGPA